jgi:hypothetical protein
MFGIVIEKYLKVAMQLVYQVADLWVDIIIKRAHKGFMRHAGAAQYPL